MSGKDCHECAVATASRRAFLREVGAAAIAALTLTAIATPAAALAESVSELLPTGAAGRRRIYDIPKGDSIAVDEANDVIVARWQDRVYAFSLKCPHRGSRLEWRGDEQRIYCPKHKARFQQDGLHASGRVSRDLDRYAVTRDGATLVVDLDVVLRSDRDAVTWRGAVVMI